MARARLRRVLHDIGNISPPLHYTYYAMSADFMAAATFRSFTHCAGKFPLRRGWATTISRQILYLLGD